VKQPTGSGDTECPNANKDKLKRVDKPQRKKIVKKVPASSPDKTSENAENEAANKD
jgi:hypothetical protein